MSKEIYNEGRVVGFSAYEIYLRHQLSEYPEMEPVTEREWLSSTLGAGCSMILRIPAGTQGVFEKQLPDNSTLCAASQITATIFDGEVLLDSTESWATRVIDYGHLIKNTENMHPTTPGESVPDDFSEITMKDRTKLLQYLKIIDGVVYQPGEWEQNSGDPKQPYNDLSSPDLHKRGFVKLYISGKIEHDINILLTGWVHRPIVAGSTKLESGSLELIHPWNGDFLGPERFPWAVKIMFVTPTNVIDVLNNLSYRRKLPSSGGIQTWVSSKPIIDYDSVDVDAFYSPGDSSTYRESVVRSIVKEYVGDMCSPGDGLSVLAVFQRDDRQTDDGVSGKNYPPVLYGNKITTEGTRYLVPIDTGAPGTVKMFRSKQKALDYPKVMPNVFSIWQDAENNGIYFIDGDTLISVDTDIETKNLQNPDIPKYTSIVRSGGKEVKAVSLVDEEGNDLDIWGNNTTEEPIGLYDDSDGIKYLNWGYLLQSLGTGRSIDLIGPELRRFRLKLPNLVSGKGGILKTTGTGLSSINGPLKVGAGAGDADSTFCNTTNFLFGARVDTGLVVTRQTPKTTSGSLKADNYNLHGSPDKIAGKLIEPDFGIDKPLRLKSNYIEFEGTSSKEGPIRLYISKTAPSTADVPVGSIGIGW